MLFAIAPATEPEVRSPINRKAEHVASNRQASRPGTLPDQSPWTPCGTEPLRMERARAIQRLLLADICSFRCACRTGYPHPMQQFQPTDTRIRVLRCRGVARSASGCHICRKSLRKVPLAPSETSPPKRPRAAQAVHAARRPFHSRSKKDKPHCGAGGISA